MPRKKMSDSERKEVSNRMKKYWTEKKDKPAPKKRGRPSRKGMSEVRKMKDEALQAARFISKCGSVGRAKDIFNMVTKLAESIQ